MMLTSKTRKVLALLTALLAVALVAGPVAQAQVKSNPTGNSELDSICQQMADLINRADSEGNIALINGDDEGAQAWYDLADYMIRRATDAGCKLSARIDTGTGDRPLDDLDVSDGHGGGGRPLPDLGHLSPDLVQVSDGQPATPTLAATAPYVKDTQATRSEIRSTKRAAKRLLKQARTI